MVSRRPVCILRPGRAIPPAGRTMVRAGAGSLWQHSPRRRARWHDTARTIDTGGPEGTTGILDTMVVTGRSGVRCGAGEPQLAGRQGCVRMLRAATGGISLERVAGLARRHPGTPVARMTRTMAGLSAGAASKIWVAVTTRGCTQADMDWGTAGAIRSGRQGTAASTTGGAEGAAAAWLARVSSATPGRVRS